MHGITFVSIPGGTFQMGGSETFRKREKGWIGGRPYLWEEKPVHQITVSSFQMSRYEVTNAQYVAYLNDALEENEITIKDGIVEGGKGDYKGYRYISLNGSVEITVPPGSLDWAKTDNKGRNYISVFDSSDNNRFCISYDGTSFSVASGKENWPVVLVSWYGAKAFAENYDFDLPREAEWEYAARGGKQYKFGTADGNISDDKANTFSNKRSLGHPSAVGSYPPNPFGLYDLAGNVWEWCNDWYGSYESASQIDPTGSTSGSDRVLKGGSYSEYDPGFFWAAHRHHFPPDDMLLDTGFRVVRR